VKVKQLISVSFYEIRLLDVQWKKQLTVERVKKMLCQNCHENEATIHLYANVNGQRKQLDYCQNCYQKEMIILVLEV
jgi:hypothetical protein